MKWTKLGIVYRPDGSREWARTHAMIPTPVRLDAATIRVFFGSLDADGRARPGFVDVDAHDPMRVLNVGPVPLLDLGRPGTFDEAGVLPCSVFRDRTATWRMYYVGFELGQRIRYRLLTGLATSADGIHFTRVSPTPVLERSAAELYFRCGPYCVETGNGYRMWYVAGSAWETVQGKEMPVYDIRYAESADGIVWPAQGRVVLPISGDDEHGFGRPWVLPDPNGGYRMFYSVRRRSLRAYRLGYARSEDGLTWVRSDDDLGLDVTPGAIDSDAIMYAAVIEVDGRVFAFYNGNEFGRAGVALARLQQE
jgi:hypothetical protein